MARPLRIVYPGACYHVMSRGNEQKDIFKSRRDREKFLEYLSSASQRYGAVIHTYCLMNNHYHMLLETPEGNLPQIMRHINGAYTTYFNVKRKRAGHLFQGRYKAILVEADSYATELSRYIHLNPVRIGLAEKPDDYSWSSYRSYTGQEPAPEWLNAEFILSYFENPGSDSKRRYRLFVEELLGKTYENPLQKAVGSAILGKAEFVERIAAKHLAQKEPEREVPALRQLLSRPSADKIIHVVEEAFGDNSRLARQAEMYLCHRYSGKKLREIGELFGVGPSAISEASRHFPKRMEQDERLEKLVKKVKSVLEV